MGGDALYSRRRRHGQTGRGATYYVLEMEKPGESPEVAGLSTPPPTISEQTADLLELADLVLIPVRPSPADPNHRRPIGLGEFDGLRYGPIVKIAADWRISSWPGLASKWRLPTPGLPAATTLIASAVNAPLRRCSTCC